MKPTPINPQFSISGYSKFKGKVHSLTDWKLINGCWLGIDTHTDNSCAGKHICILEYIDGPTYNVAHFHDNYKPIESVNMINGIAAVDSKDRKSYILELNNFLDFTKIMDNFFMPHASPNE